MFAARHLLHPIRTTRIVCHHLGVSLCKAFYGKEPKDIRRTSQDKCWCGGALVNFKWHKNYGICEKCGTYVNRRPPTDEELSRIYSFDYYWHTRQKLHGNPTIEHRPMNDRSDGRVEHWLRLIEQHGTTRGRAIEIGCGSGVLLSELQRRGYQCIGVDVDEKSAGWIRDNMGLDVRAGIFPNIDLPPCSLFLALDVLEHTKRPLEFLKRASDLLEHGGIAVIQAPIDRDKQQPPFGRRFEDAFDDLEHLFLFTDTAMAELGKQSGLEVVTFDEALWVMGELAVFRKP